MFSGCDLGSAPHAQPSSCTRSGPGPPGVWSGDEDEGDEGFDEDDEDDNDMDEEEDEEEEDDDDMEEEESGMREKRIERWGSVCVCASLLCCAACCLRQLTKGKKGGSVGYSRVVVLQVVVYLKLVLFLELANSIHIA